MELSLDDMKDQIKKWCKQENLTYIEILKMDSYKNIYNLVINNKKIEPNDDVVTCTYYGSYFKKINNYAEMKKYYLMAIDKGYPIAMHNLGFYYERVEKNYDLMKKYYLMAFDKGCSSSMNYLGFYYKSVEKNYDLMKKYYLMAIDKGYPIAMHNLGFYYERVEKNYDLMKKYYLMAIDKENPMAMYNLGTYYEKCEENYDLMKKYYLMAANLNDKGAKSKINNILKNNIDIELFIKSYEFVNEENLDKFNKLFLNYDKYKNLLKEQIYLQFECLNCNTNTKCTFKLCGHGFCVNCYQNKCRLCS